MFTDDEGPGAGDERWETARAAILVGEKLRHAPCSLCERDRWEDDLYWLDDLPFCTQAHRALYQEITADRAQARAERF